METKRVNIKGLPKAAVLKALHDGTRPLRMGWLQAKQELTPAEAEKDVEQRKGNLRFDYYYGRPLKVDISGDEFDPWLYDRDAPNGGSSAAKVIEELRKQLDMPEEAQNEEGKNKAT